MGRASEDLMEYLRSVKDAKIEILRCERRIRDLTDAATHITQVLSAAPGGHSGDSQHDAALVALADSTGELRDSVVQYTKRIREVEAFINRIRETSMRTIMKLRYVDCMSWNSVYDELLELGIPYEQSQIFKLHRDALMILQRLWEEINENRHSEK